MGGKRTRRQLITLITLAIGNLTVACSVSLQAPFFPQEAENKGATATEYGLVFGVYSLTMFLISPVFGKIVALVRPKFMLNAGFYVVGITCILFGVIDRAPNGTPFLVLAFLIRIAEGFGSSAIMTASFTIIAAEFPKHVATTFGTLETFFGVGLIIGPTLGGALYEAQGYYLPFVVVGSMLVVCGTISFFFLPASECNSDEKTGNFLKFWMNIGVILNALCIAMAFTCIGYISATLEPHLRQFQLSPFVVGCVFVISGAMYAISATAWGWLCDRNINTKILCICGCLLLSASLLFLGPAPFMPFEPQVWIIIVSLVMFGTGVGASLVCSFIGALRDTIKRGFPDDLTTYGLASSVFSSSNSLGCFVGPSLGGYLLDTVGFRGGTVVILCMEVTLAAALALYLIVQAMKGKNEALLPEEKEPLIKACQNGVTKSSSGSLEKRESLTHSGKIRSSSGKSRSLSQSEKTRSLSQVETTLSSSPQRTNYEVV